MFVFLKVTFSFKHLSIPIIKKKSSSPKESIIKKLKAFSSAIIIIKQLKIIKLSTEEYGSYY